MQEQALEYAARSEQGDAYAGIREGRTVACRAMCMYLSIPKVSKISVVVVVLVVVNVLVSVSTTVPGTVVVSVTTSVVNEVGRVVTVRDAVVQRVTLWVVDMELVRVRVTVLVLGRDSQPQAQHPRSLDLEKATHTVAGVTVARKKEEQLELARARLLVFATAR